MLGVGEGPSRRAAETAAAAEAIERLRAMTRPPDPAVGARGRPDAAMTGRPDRADCAPRRASSRSASRASSRSPSGRAWSSGPGSARSSGRTGRARATSPTPSAGRSASRAGRSGRASREDVIWAGSEKRARSGHGRRHPRPRQRRRPAAGRVRRCSSSAAGCTARARTTTSSTGSRIRLRDLVDLLDAAHLADNAFLFIGQGMVDQALALRPEERRPLFEEVAGVRRHERRRRRAEEQLVESEANLARVEDILGRAPAAGAPAGGAGRAAGDARDDRPTSWLSALLVATHARWHEAAARLARRRRRPRSRPRRRSTRAMTALTAAEADGGGPLGRARRPGASSSAERREAHDAARAARHGAQLRDARLASELEALDARPPAASSMSVPPRRPRSPPGDGPWPSPVPPPDICSTRPPGEAERELADALAELGALRSAKQAQGEELAALRRAAAARQAERETARRRLAEGERRAADEAAPGGRRVRATGGPRDGARGRQDRP